MVRDFDNFEEEQQQNDIADVVSKEEQTTTWNDDGIDIDRTNTQYAYSFWAEQAGNKNAANDAYPNHTYQYDTYQEASQSQQEFNGYGYQEDPFMQQTTQGDPVAPTKRSKKITRTVGKYVAIVACGVVFGLGSYGVYKLVQPNQVTAPAEGTTPTTDNTEGTQGGSSGDTITSTTIAQTQVKENVATDNGVVDMVKNAMPSIVQITITVPQSNLFGQTYNATGSGSGIILKEENGKILVATNYHVVQGANDIDVIFVDNESVKATVKGYDSTNDLAVLEIKLSDIKESTKKQIKVATLGNSNDVKVGEMAIAIGNALGYGQSVTVGYVSAKDRIVDVDGVTMVLLQTDAAINPGNSGGALFNAKGEVIGINSVKLSDETVEGMGYAIPITKATPIIDDLMTREQLTEDEKGYLGISGQNVDEEASSYFNMPAGVFVKEVAEGGAADLAGIKPNDIITKINDIEVTSIQGLAERVNSYRKGTEVTLTISRQENSVYEEIQVKVKLQGKETLDSLESDSSTTDSAKDQNANGSNGSNGSSDIPYDGNGNGGNNGQNPYGNNSGNESDIFNDFPWDLFE